MKVPVKQKAKKKNILGEKNRILRSVDYVIAYVKELRQLPLVKSVNACILMQQFDYWFNIQGTKGRKSFYKFLEPCDNQRAYQQGDSWTEELGMSPDEFKTAFGQIGVTYKSKGIYDAAPDKFQGKYYCSYMNRVTRETVYFRNDELIERDLDNLFLGNGQSQPVETSNTKIVESDNSRTVETDISDSVENKFIELESTETTSDNTAKITTDNSSKREKENLSPNTIFGTNEEIKNKKDNNDSFYSTSLDIKDFSDDSENDEIIEGIPIIDESYSSSWTSSSAGYLPSDFKVTDVMREWVKEETQKGNVKSGINIDRATQKFILYNTGNMKSNWINQWKLWIMKERPEQSSYGSMNASQRQTEQFRRLAEEDPYANLSEDYNDDYKRFINASQRRVQKFKELEEKDNYADVTD